MKTLYLLRHAKSDRAGFSGSDHERPLATRGIAAARSIGDFCLSNGIKPDGICCSTSTRTRQTLDLVKGQNKWHDVPVVFDRRIYLTSPELVMQVIRDSGFKGDSILVVGHEPTMEALTSGLIGGGRIRFPTGALARVDLALTSWTTLHPGIGHLTFHVTPRLSLSDL